ncbi:hypothetical protein AGR8A_Cc30724 [Agrobacterium fabrum str. J-07]|nr:hypothetical protein AGR8A_Cc30724 [Agrobacterium fabrum str. J-07]
MANLLEPTRHLVLVWQGKDAARVTTALSSPYSNLTEFAQRCAHSPGFNVKLPSKPSCRQPT